MYEYPYCINIKESYLGNEIWLFSYLIIIMWSFICNHTVNWIRLYGQSVTIDRLIKHKYMVNFIQVNGAIYFSMRVIPSRQK